MLNTPPGNGARRGYLLCYTAKGMHTVQRFDATGRLGKVKRTPQGGIEAPARLTRSGVFVYTNPDGSERREYRPPEEVFSERSLATLANAPVTNLHPSGMVSSSNYRDLSVGHLSGEARQDGEYLEGNLVIQDEHTISLVEQGERGEVSLGYTCAYDPSPGKTPSGERYDGVQRDITYNHVALVQRGRAGRKVALRLDAEGNQRNMNKIEMIDGVEYEFGSDAHSKAKSDQAQARKDAADRLSQLEAERDQLRAELDGHAARFDAAVQERVALVEMAKSRGVEVNAEDSNADVRKAVLTKLSPSLRLDGKDEAYVEAALDFALQSGNLAESVKAAHEERKDEGPAPRFARDELARENMRRRLSGRPESDRFGKVQSR